MKKNIFIIEIVGAMLLAFLLGIGLGLYLGGGLDSNNKPSEPIVKKVDPFEAAERYIDKTYLDIRGYFGAPQRVMMQGEQAYITFNKNGTTYLFDKTLIKDNNYLKLALMPTADNAQLNLNAKPVLNTFGMKLKELLKTEKEFITANEIKELMPRFRYYMPESQAELTEQKIKFIKPNPDAVGVIFADQYKGYDISLFISELEWDVARIHTQKIVYFNKITLEDVY